LEITEYTHLPQQELLKYKDFLKVVRL
jgi:hypothetical protein